MNLELAEKVLAHIKEHREAFNMSFGVESGYGTHKIDSYPRGTVACIAGWTVLLDYANRDDRAQLKSFVEIIENHWDWSDVSLCAQKLLEISHHDAIALFSPPPWDEDFCLSKREQDEAIARLVAFEDVAIAQFEGFIEREKKDAANLIDAFSP